MLELLLCTLTEINYICGIQGLSRPHDQSETLAQSVI